MVPNEERIKLLNAIAMLWRNLNSMGRMNGFRAEEYISNPIWRGPPPAGVHLHDIEELKVDLKNYEDAWTRANDDYPNVFYN